MFGGISMLFAAMRVRDGSIRREGINPELLSVVSSVLFMPTVVLTCALPALFASLFLHSKGYTRSALLTGTRTFLLGWLNARFLTRSLSKPTGESPIKEVDPLP